MELPCFCHKSLLDKDKHPSSRPCPDSFQSFRSLSIWSTGSKRGGRAQGPLTLWRGVNKRDWPISPRWFLAWQRSGVGACFHKSSPHEQPGNHFPEFSQSRTNAKDGRHGANKHSLRECHAMLRDLAHSWVTKTSARQPGTRVNPFQCGTDQGPRWGPVCYPRTGVVEPCPDLGGSAGCKSLHRKCLPFVLRNVTIFLLFRPGSEKPSAMLLSPWRRSQVVRQRSAKPPSRVRISAAPLTE